MIHLVFQIADDDKLALLITKEKAIKMLNLFKDEYNNDGKSAVIIQGFINDLEKLEE